MSRRVKKPKQFEDLLQTLTDIKEVGVFETYKDLMLFAASLGAYHNESKPFKEYTDPIDYSIFNRHSDNEVLILLLALYHTNDIQILSDNSLESRLKILEEYANAGLYIIKAKISKSSNNLDAILNLIQDIEESDSKSEASDFSKILKELKG